MQRKRNIKEEGATFTPAHIQAAAIRRSGESNDANASRLLSPEITIMWCRPNACNGLSVRMNKVLLALLVMLSLSMVYAATVKAKEDKTAAKKDDSKKEKTTGRGDVPDKREKLQMERKVKRKKKIPGKTKNVQRWIMAMKHSDDVLKKMHEIKKKFEAIIEEKGLSPIERRKKLWALFRKNPTAYTAVVRTYHHIRAPHGSARKRMNKVLLILLAMLSLSMVYAAAAKAKEDKTAAKKDDSKKEKTAEKTNEGKWWISAKKHSDDVLKKMPEIKKKFEDIVEEKGLFPKQRRAKLFALWKENPTAYNALVRTYYFIRLPHRSARKKSH
ncbi:hypothetical protein GCK32_001521 [Trichostrongylus colubriformis]|uniref:Uncharacterized protein n=1 Tax=Trichostrongylus colubriformis TaxID=6319 RepID=A0AAN8IN02_TRICO